jgi:copper(I)-binding protein
MRWAMRTLSLIAFIALTLVSVTRAVGAADPPGISLEHVWARASAGGATTGAVYFTIVDNGAPDRLVGVSTPAAASAQLHESINDNGVMKMRAAPSIALETGKPVTFKPGGHHVMLFGLKAPLKAGGDFPLTLTFEHAPPMTVTTAVEAVGSMGMDHQHGAMGAMPGHADHKH